MDRILRWGCLVFGAPAWQGAARDQWIGWSASHPFSHPALGATFTIPITGQLLAQLARRIDCDPPVPSGDSPDGTAATVRQ